MAVACLMVGFMPIAQAKADWSPPYIPPKTKTPAPPTVPSSAPANISAPASAPAPTQELSRELEVAGNRQWTDTGVDVHAGDRVVISSQGTIKYSANQSSGPEGLPRTWRDLLLALPVNEAGEGALIGRIGDEAAEVPFLLGSEKELTVNRGGRLQLGVNQTANQAGEGSFHVKIQIVPTAPQSKTAAPALSVSPALFDQIPRRVTDRSGKPGDMVNFVILGPQEKVQAAFQAAGWVQVDRTKKEAILHAALSSLSKEVYLRMPMSELYLFGRPQDFGYARAEPVAVVASRNHLRLWKAPMEMSGQTLWVGAATHDIGFEKDQRTGGVTHKIDPAIDDEREFVGQTLDATGGVSLLDHVVPLNPLTGETHTATGGSFHSDGRILVIVLK
jgi:hypothetical protein